MKDMNILEASPFFKGEGSSFPKIKVKSSNDGGPLRHNTT